MVLTIPAGAPIPAPDISKRHLLLTVDDHAVEQTQNNIRDTVTSIVNALNPSSACDGIFTVLNLESLLPAYLKKSPSPLEVGAVRFSLREGVEEERYHAYVDPGRVPTGYMHEAQEHSAARHQIPVLDFTEPRLEHRDVITQLLDFMRPNNAVFTLQARVSVTQQSLDWVAEQCDLKRQFLVLPLELLSSQLITLSGASPSPLRLTDELQPQSLQHVTHIGCRFHAVRDVACCAVSDSVRQAVACKGLLQRFFWGQLTEGTNTHKATAPALSDPPQDPNLPHPTNPTLPQNSNLSHPTRSSTTEPCVFDVPDIFKTDSQSETSSASSDYTPRYDQRSRSYSPANKHICQTSTRNPSLGPRNPSLPETTPDYSPKPFPFGRGRGFLTRSLNSSLGSSSTTTTTRPGLSPTTRPGLGRAGLRAAWPTPPRSPQSGT